MAKPQVARTAPEPGSGYRASRAIDCGDGASPRRASASALSAPPRQSAELQARRVRDLGRSSGLLGEQQQAI